MERSTECRLWNQAGLKEIALISGMHVSQVVRMACAERVSGRSQTGTTYEPQPLALRVGWGSLVRRRSLSKYGYERSLMAVASDFFQEL